ncbi:hypothetical protein BJ684DRAFT_16493 [Piptocephalis cylindrospora]|uniref:DNA repair protein RAD51 homolog 3 n=1 Tax=Piptocephalis cylindrospora TaxID=1907219 RepID=A0A4P9Y2J4_9FUNG|nr:hypothetical protein BJ684DRAFT_16493 [Piptocephalis cylindrospora]|eukprot:RKP13067.1 hypothetical protein BJ684DRAFT_16493 [Piptocephalis cylindrospora]
MDVQMDRLEAMAKNAPQSGVGADRWQDRLQYHRVWSLSQVSATIHTLPTSMSSTSQAPKCIILDGMTTPYRSFQGDSRIRTRTLLACGQALRSLAASSSICIIVTNQMTHRLSDDGSSLPIPALGDSWTHVPTHRIVLDPTGHIREGQCTGHLIKSPDRLLDQAHFSITTTGISDGKGRKRPFLQDGE